MGISIWDGKSCVIGFRIHSKWCLLLKPDMSKVITGTDFFKPMETYVLSKTDWSDLNETIEKVFNNYRDYQYIIDNGGAESCRDNIHIKMSVCIGITLLNQSGVESGKITSVIPTYNNLPFLKSNRYINQTKLLLQ